MDDCIFCKIVRKEIPKEYEFEDENVVAFKDINPVADTHILFIPKTHVKDFAELADDAVLLSVKKGIQALIEKNQLMGRGYKVVVNGGGAQFVDHLHFHLVGPIGNQVPV